MALAFTLEERINAPPERVFDTLIDLDDADRWMPGLVRFEKLSEGPLRPGAEFRETRKMFGREATEHFQVTELARPTTWALLVDGTKGSSKRGEFRFRYTLAPDDGGTLLRLEAVVDRLGWIGGLIGRLFLGSMKKAMAKDLSALRSFVEGRLTA